ncbi:receptor kinase-like protein Xa21 [Bidens hawaiensis]|uniref:receptor kinase-like protein Xa21 n=1 Tax=Bidens hawaiensis TaxID=980011 RepID=UPI0040495B50
MKLRQPIILLSSSSHICFIFNALIILTFIVISASYGENETDLHALLKIKSMITRGDLKSWNDSLKFCFWSGVYCGKQHRRVTMLILDSQGIEGSLSPHVGNLSFLQKLSFRNNSFHGTIPHELGRLPRLRVLNLGLNKFNGVIPANLSGCSNLEELDLSVNELVGSIPKEMSSLSKLSFLSLSYNNLTGGIQPFLGNITSMEMFFVVENPLGGSIPDTIRHWRKVKSIYGGFCNLYGTIPHSLYNLSLLTNISLQGNQLTGRLPMAIGAMLPHLVLFQLRANQLSGPLPSSISNCSRLRRIELTRNKFSGKLKIDFAKLGDLIYINLSNNNFGSNESDEMKFIDSLENCTKLENLILYKCEFQGVLPRSIVNLSDKLNFMSFEKNHLQGNLPRLIGNLVGLGSLYLGTNRFTGNIPSTIGNLRNLQVVDLSGNKLSGQIPDAFGNLSLLTKLFLSLNNLEGVIPSSLGKLPRLLNLLLNENELTGTIPSQLFQLSSLSIRLDLSQNNLFGSLPTEIGDLNMLSEMDLSDNNLSGNIPSSLGGCVSLSRLSLKGNLFQGVVPQSLSSLKGLVELDISHNNLSGQIPQFLEWFLLEYLNLSYNNLEGEVPMQGVFSNGSRFSVWENNRLCGGIVELGLPKCKEIRKHTKKFILFVIIMLIASTLFITICLSYVWCKKNKSQGSETSMSQRFLEVSYNQLLKATNGFSESNLIGNGAFSSVYKGLLDEDGIFVAVKVIHIKNRGAQRSFMRECEVWRNIRHRHILKIITSCSSVDFQGNDFKALVYEFMPNGSLHDWLHSSKRTSRLNLLQRINILTDVAYALDYIHNQCVPTIVHCDLKPSNILLDDDMVAHVGDFGLARFLGKTSKQNNSTGIRGTIGYTPPEYGLGNEMTSSGDVYSFGILLLEVMTGKRPTHDMFNEGLSLHKYASMALPGHVTNIIDVNIIKAYEDKIAKQNCEANAKRKEEHECFTSIINIGVSCSMDSPQQRMDIQTVLYELQHILSTLQNI